MLALPVAKQHKTNHWESSAEGHNNLESDIAQQVFACVELQGVCTADLALLSSGCICTVHCENLPSLYPWPHKKVQHCPQPAQQEGNTLPGLAPALLGDVQHTEHCKSSSWIKWDCLQLASPGATPIPPPSTEPLSRREGNLPLVNAHLHIGNWRSHRDSSTMLAVQGKWRQPCKEAHIKYKKSSYTLH